VNSQNLYLEINPLTKEVIIHHSSPWLHPSLPHKEPKPHKRTYLHKNRPNPSPMGTRQCFKCQGLSHITTNFLNRKVITWLSGRPWRTKRFDKPLILLFSFLDLTTLLHLFPQFMEELDHLCSSLLTIVLLGSISLFVGILLPLYRNSSSMAHK